jgi:HEAT repeat protein
MKSHCLAMLLLVAASPEQIRNIVSDLGADSFAKREAAQKQLLELGEQVEPYLKDAIVSKDPEIRERAREILAQVGAGDIEKPDPKILAEVEALLEPVMGSGHENLNALVQMGKRATPSLVAIANRVDDRKSIYAMIALTRAADPRCFPVLAKLFQFDNLARHMTGYVSNIKDPQMLHELIKLWQKLGADASERLREQVKTMSRQQLGDDPAAYRKWFQEKHAGPASP